MHDLLISPINLDARARAVLRIGVEAKLLENSKLALMCCSDELRGWVSNNSP